MADPILNVAAKPIHVHITNFDHKKGAAALSQGAQNLQMGSGNRIVAVCSWNFRLAGGGAGRDGI